MSTHINPRIVPRDGDDLNIKYRPLRFGELYGPTRRSAVQFYNWLVASDRKLTKHSFLISGESGTGKTTLALIVSLSMNCENPLPNPKTGDKIEPCLKCNSCKRILYNAMSNPYDSPVRFYNSPSIDKDQIRTIIANDITGPKPIYRPNVVVTIFDEAHGLTWEQRQPLLTTLESMPSYSYVFFLTSRPDKFIKIKNGSDKALFSRISVIDLKPWSVQEIEELLRDIAYVEHDTFQRPKISSDALNYLAQIGDGNPRQAVSALDMVLNGTNGETVFEITLEHVKRFYPGVMAEIDPEKNEELGPIFRAFYNNDVRSLLNKLEELEKNGYPAEQLKYVINKFLRNRVYQYSREGNDAKLQEFMMKLYAFSHYAFSPAGEEYSNLVTGCIRALQRN